MPYKHQDILGNEIKLPVGKALCVGRNYAAHAKELGNDIPEVPLLFMKPRTALCKFDKEIIIPKNKGSVHFETEIAVLLKSSLTAANESQVMEAIWGYGVALDLTLRDVQNELKAKSQPWEKAKAFDGACPVTGFISTEEITINEIQVNSSLNEKQVQLIKPENMLWSVLPLIAYMSECFTLEAGDIVLTGTPEGVGALKQGDQFSVAMFKKEQEVFHLSASIQ